MGTFPTSLPPRVQAALDTLEHLRYVEASCDIGQRELTPVQSALQGTAMQVLRLYLSGEMDYGDAPPSLPPEEPPQPQPEPAPVGG